MSMNLLRLFRGRTATAPVARERLQILLAHERGLLGQPDLLVTLREEILAVVSRHIQLDPDKVTVKLDRGKTVSTLEVDIEVPNGFETRSAAAGGRPASGALPPHAPPGTAPRALRCALSLRRDGICNRDRRFDRRVVGITMSVECQVNHETGEDRSEKAEVDQRPSPDSAAIFLARIFQKWFHR